MISDEGMGSIWFRGKEWAWPYGDTKLKLVNDWVDDIDVALRLFGGRKVAIQAGGACGMWPIALSASFDMVYTWEPHSVNYLCMMRNIQLYHRNNIMPFMGALGEESGTCEVKLPIEEVGNAGAYYTVPSAGPGVHVSKIDEILTHADFIALDIEGREIEALRGAQNLIEKCSPVIMLEEKHLPQMGGDVPYQKGDAVQWLKERGYQVIAKIHRDIILAVPGCV